VAARTPQEVIEPVPQCDCPEVRPVFDYPPVICVDPAFAWWNCHISLGGQPADPRREAGRAVDIIVWVETSTRLIDPTTPFIACSEP